MNRRRIVIMGAAGRDFHNFQTCYRDDSTVEVVAFTANQIPGIAGRPFPADLAGPLYPDGIPILDESELPRLIREHDVQSVVFAYSDIAHEDVMHRASLVLACGADFELLGPARTMIPSTKPVVSVCAVRTGVGKSGISKYVWELLRERGLTAVDVRHPMPYRNLSRMRVERYATIEDLDRFGCTIEEREEYEHLVAMGIIVYAGVDYEAVLREAEKEADVVIWDGGNNDLPFFRSDLEIVALDPHRLGHERRYHPGEANFLRADVLVVNKVDSARPEDIDAVMASAAEFNPGATVVKTASAITAEEPERLAGKRVLVVEDGPTVTHGGMAYGAGALAARRFGAELADPRPYAVKSIRAALEAYPHLTDILPAVGYSAEQLADLQETIAAVPCDFVVIGTPIDLSRLIDIPQPTVRVTYSVQDAGSPTLADVIDRFVADNGLGG
ncbi:MAG: cyclic 2,3-diphosphoglycerate synthase [Actinomycetota bacterium]|nr:cyclic 2,3-diphosphoglycerate synthase [Actinomycetota bacterium]